jgi:glutathione S-transferase
MQLIGMLDSPYVRRVAVTALIADAPFQHRPISLFRHIPEFAALSPLLKAPSLIADDGTVLVESGVILDYLATVSAAVARMKPNTLPAFRANGVALTVCEKAVQVHYERALRKPEERSDTWIARVSRQLNEGLAALEREVPGEGWIGGGAIGVADVTIVCAFGFIQSLLADVVEVGRYPRLAGYCAAAEKLPAFRAAPPIDGVAAAAQI